LIHAGKGRASQTCVAKEVKTVNLEAWQIDYSENWGFLHDFILYDCHEHARTPCAFACPPFPAVLDLSCCKDGLM
jgi:hypothetical protein